MATDCVGAQPPHGGLDVVNLSREPGLSAQPVVDAGERVASGKQRGKGPGRLIVAFIAKLESPAVGRDHERKWSRCSGKIEVQLLRRRDLRIGEVAGNQRRGFL